MFGLILAGRPVETAFRQVDATHVVADVDLSASAASHIVVFLTGQQGFPEEMGGAVYFAFPPSAPAGEHPVWQFLGVLSNTKPSAIFKIVRPRGDQETGLNNNGASPADLVARFGGQRLSSSSSPSSPTAAPSMPAATHAQLGISMEPLTQLSGMVPAASSELSSVPAFLEFSQKMTQSLFNYAASFAVTPAQLVSGEAGLRQSETFVPFSTLQSWYANFERRLQQNPHFWKS